MSKRKKTPNTAAMLELWRPPQDAGEAVGCLASTYTFAPELFDEQCLARFLEIESEPDREDLAFLLEREIRLGGQNRNAEANLLTIIDRVAYGRDASSLEAVWPEMEQVEQPETAQWLGTRPDPEETDTASTPPLPAGFLAATYRAGDERRIVLRLDAPRLPEDWRIHAHGQGERELLSAYRWRESGCPPVVELAWNPVHPPEKLRVFWSDFTAFLPLNVEDSRALPPPSQLEQMSANDMLLILAAPVSGGITGSVGRRASPRGGTRALGATAPDRPGRLARHLQQSGAERPEQAAG